MERLFVILCKTSTMNENNSSQQPDNSVSGYYENYNETQKEVMSIETRKTRNTLFITSLVFLASGFLTLAMLNTFTPEMILGILILPVIISGLALLANKEPMTAMIITAVVILAEWIYSVIINGGFAVITGWLVKAVIIYLVIAGFQHAKEVARIKKELKI